MHDDEPEAYKEGWVPFLGLKIYLNSRPLIPRPETEWWTEKMIERLVARRDTSLSGYGYFSAEKSLGLGPSPSGTSLDESISPRVLDLCSGSGAVGCAILKHCPDAKVYFGEIDPTHEATIRKNIRENALDEGRADVRIGDLFAPFAGMQFDVVAANPPYVPEGRELPASVADYEPALALRAGEDGLAVIRRIAMDLPNYLKPGGQAWIECDISNIEEARALFEQGGYEVVITQDQYERPRLLVISS